MSDGKESDAKHVANLVMIVGRLVQQVRKHDSDNPVVEKAMDYLRRCDLTPSVVRGVGEPGDNAGEYVRADVAKELLAACKAAAAVICNHESGHVRTFADAFDKLTDAISKAESPA